MYGANMEYIDISTSTVNIPWRTNVGHVGKTDKSINWWPNNKGYSNEISKLISKFSTNAAKNYLVNQMNATWFR